jgi:Ca2+-transporting ATPase
MPPLQPQSSDEGLSALEAQQRLAREGPNELASSRPLGLLRLVGSVVMEPMFLLLVACGVIYMALGDAREALMLLGFVFVVMGITLVQQRRTERSLQALRDLSSPRALVIRDGQAQRIAGPEVVRGDVVLLAEGDRVPADIQLLEASNLAIDESLLSGESVPANKFSVNSPGVSAEASTAFCGTLVTRGTARGCVIATGVRSALGRIGQSLATITSERTPIQAETNRIVKRVATVGLILASGLAIAYGWTRGDWLHGLLAGITLAMGILPEELPVVLAIFMGLGAWRLARENVLTRNTPAVELLGATTVLCVDKTGTLTTNHMILRCLYAAEVTVDLKPSTGQPLQEELHEVLEFAVLASHRRAFDPMESAIGQAGQRLLAQTEHLHSDWVLIEDYPLSSELLAMSRVWQSPNQQQRMIATKGAPEAIISLCHLAPQEHQRITAQVSAMADKGLRVLGVARAIFNAGTLPATQHDFEFSFLGLVGLEDPVRDDVPQAIAECQAAGIRVVMITGDHPATALSIARQAGLVNDGLTMTGAELSSLSDEALQTQLEKTQIFCRVQPEQKLRLVQAFRAQGHIVAMTGDGVNDAPALKAAHIGVAMGARGTDVAREAASLVLLKDDFASLVTAVRYGRRVFANLRKAIVFVIAAHVPILGLSIAPVLMGGAMILMPVHILFLQLIIDPACSIVFEAEPSEAGAMRVKPRPPSMPLFSREVWMRGLAQGVGLLCILLAMDWGARTHLHPSSDALRTLIFLVLILSSLGLILVNRSWGATRWWDTFSRNPTFIAMTLATMALLGAVLGIPTIRSLFTFEPLNSPLLAVGAVALVLAVGCFEMVKRLAFRQNH